MGKKIYMGFREDEFGKWYEIKSVCDCGHKSHSETRKPPNAWEMDNTVTCSKCELKDDAYWFKLDRHKGYEIFKSGQHIRDVRNPDKIRIINPCTCEGDFNARRHFHIEKNGKHSKIRILKSADYEEYSKQMIAKSQEYLKIEKMYK